MSARLRAARRDSRSAARRRAGRSGPALLLAGALALASGLWACSRSQESSAAGGEPAAQLGPAAEQVLAEGSMVDGPSPLWVAPESAPAARQAFVRALQTHAGSLRPLYEAWIDRIGANGILDAIELLRPTCHSEAHDLGKVAYARLGTIGAGLRACDRRCHSGCMHGVLMEAFAAMCSRDGQLHLELLAPSVELVCMEEPEMRADYSIGDCAHGVGHALMFLANYGIERSLAACSGFRDERMQYYCATGAYMEFVTAGKADATIRDASFYPCDAHPWSAACARYLMPRLLHSELETHKSAQRLVELCRAQTGATRLGCWHGFGNAFMPWIASGEVQLSDVCLKLDPEAQHVCIEGAMERMARYQPQRAASVCSELEGLPRESCDRAIQNEMYSFDKDFTPYLR